jgi:hypothetical protein
MRRLALASAVLVVGCTTPVDLSPSPSSSTAVATGPGGGIAGDQPCTRSVPSEPDVVDVPFQLDDLERMIPRTADVPDLIGFEDDFFLHGYHDNAELSSLVPNPPATCENLQRFGRLTGFGIGYARPDDPTHDVLLAVHLFADDAGASAWSDAFFGGLQAAVGAGGGPQAFTLERPAGLPPDTLLAEHVGGDGVRTWAAITRGSIVGWVIDLHREGDSPIDVPGAVTVLADHIERVTADAAGRERDGPDASHLLSAPMPLSSYGDRGAGLSWDSFFGGCADAFERGMVAGDQARLDAEQLGRRSGCTALYAPAGAAAANGTVRVFSSVQVYGDEQGASASLPASIAGLESGGGERFAVAGVGDEAIGLTAPTPGEGPEHVDTRIVFRRGVDVGTVAIQSNDRADISDEAGDLARALDQRMAEFLGR